MGNTKGKLVRWIDNRGFGFIKPEHGEDDIFIHISALKGMRRKPIVGDIIHYEISLDANGKTRAVNAKIEGVEQVLTSEPLKHKGKKSTYRKSTNVNKPSKSFKLLPILIAIVIVIVNVIVIGFVFNAFQEWDVGFIPFFEEQKTNTEGDQQLTRAYENQQSDVQVGGTGIVIRTLSDDTKGSQHQRFLLKL